MTLNKDNGSWYRFFTDPVSLQSRQVRYYDELETQIRQLSGYNFETLEKLFAAGYTLTPPDYSSTHSLSEMAEKDDDFKR